MDTSSYAQSVLVGGVLSFPNYDYVPPGQVVKQEKVNTKANPTSTFTLMGSISTRINVSSNAPSGI